jgi:hypothetical protein
MPHINILPFLIEDGTFYIMYMLSRTFQCAKGLGENFEAIIWASGINTWHDLHQSVKPPSIHEKKWRALLRSVTLMQKAIERNNFSALTQFLPPKMQWRLIPELLGQIAYVDIETTGLSRFHHHITTIALCDGKKVEHFIYGENLDDFPRSLAQYPAIATFFGKCFDIPFLLHAFRNSSFQIPPIHFDICFLLRKVGIMGGLKKIEQQFGINRGDVDGIDGEMGVALWDFYRNTSNRAYLDSLLAYNIEDVLNLEFFLRTSYNKIVQAARLDFPLLATPQNRISNPFSPNLDLITPFIQHFSNNHHPK